MILDILRIESLESPLLAPYRNLRERTLRGESLFIAEGHLVVQRLLDSPFEVESVLISAEALERLSPTLAAKLAGIPIYLIPDSEFLSKLAGFPFHQGVMALGRRKTLPNFSETIENCGGKPGIWVILPDATKPDNLGLVFRSSAALGVSGVVLGERCCDPFSRRALRVSMGGVLQVPVVQARNLLAEIRQIRAASGLQFYATVLDKDAVPLDQFEERPRQMAILFGNEYDGLAPEYVSLCHAKLTIPMAPGVDSLNLGVSVGIFLYELRRAYRHSDSGFL